MQWKHTPNEQTGVQSEYNFKRGSDYSPIYATRYLACEHALRRKSSFVLLMLLHTYQRNPDCWISTFFKT